MSQQILLFFLSPLLKWVVGTWGVGAVGIFLFFTWPRWLPGERFANWAGIGGACLICGGAFYWYAFHAGERHMVQRIAAKDKAAIERIERGAEEVLQCNDGIDWDPTVGACVPGSGGF